VAIADPLPEAEATTQETRTLSRIPDRERRRVPRTMPRLAPGRYLAIDIGDEVVLRPLDREFMHVGRSPTSNIVLDDVSVSRKHALIARRGERTLILDDRSRNGVHVNGVRVRESELRDGDTVLCGNVTLRFFERSV
jgi:pSer/pThr/pTyr-binding forkhead associated (FHA) protein